MCCIYWHHMYRVAWYSWALIYCSYSTSYTQCLPLSPHVDCSWPCAGNWPPLESSLQEAGGEDLQNTEEGTGQEDPGSWPRDPPPQHSREEGGEGSPGTHTTGHAKIYSLVLISLPQWPILLTMYIQRCHSKYIAGHDSWFVYWLLVLSFGPFLQVWCFCSLQYIFVPRVSPPGWVGLFSV